MCLFCEALGKIFDLAIQGMKEVLFLLVVNNKAKLQIMVSTSYRSKLNLIVQSKSLCLKTR